MVHIFHAGRSADVNSATTLATLDGFFSKGDLLGISSLGFLLTGFLLIRSHADRFRHCVTRLHNRKAIDLDQQRPEEFIAEYISSADAWARLFSPIFAILLAGMYLFAFHAGSRPYLLAYGVGAGILGYVAGGYLGRMAYFGQLGWVLQRRGRSIVVSPWHVDQMGGLKPVGEFFSTQAMIIGIPAFHLGLWIILMRVWRDGYAAEWLTPYVVLLVAVIMVQILAFIAPLWSFHEVMVGEKDRILRGLDRRYLSSTAIAEKLWQPGRSEFNKSEREEWEFVEKFYLTVDRMPTWPVDLRAWRRFALKNVVLVFPLVHQALPDTLNLQTLINAVGKIGVP